MFAYINHPSFFVPRQQAIASLPAPMLYANIGVFYFVV